MPTKDEPPKAEAVPVLVDEDVEGEEGGVEKREITGVFHLALDNLMDRADRELDRYVAKLDRAAFAARRASEATRRNGNGSNGNGSNGSG